MRQCKANRGTEGTNHQVVNLASRWR